jgi:hypothetical protein
MEVLMSFIVPFLPYIIPALIGAGTTVYEGQAQRAAQERMQAEAHKQQQEQEMSQRQQAERAGTPGIQSQTSGSLTPQSQQAQAGELIGSPAFGGGMPTATGGGLTPAIENLFPSGGVPSLTEPWPTFA